MNKAEFLSCVSLKTEFPAGVDENLKEVINKYPFFQGAHTLLARSLNQSNNILFSEAIKNAALYSGNRKHLFSIIHNRNEKQSSNEITLRPQESQNSIPSDFEHENSLTPSSVETEIIAQIINYPEVTEHIQVESTEDEDLLRTPPIKTVNVLANERASFSSWLKRVQTPKEERKADTQPPISNSTNEQANNLIERFIQTDPRISKPSKTEFYSPILMAKKSVEDNDTIVSETLANIYIDQGNTEKAIRIFEKLSLLYPDKSTYFAALIKNLGKTDLL
jgi:hypothetical protein